MFDLEDELYRDERGLRVTDEFSATELLAALLLYVAKGDGSISAIESDKMIDLLSSHLGLRSAQALETLSKMVIALQEDPDIARTLRQVGEQLEPAEKRQVITMMLEVAAADHVQDPGELEAINMAARILNMSKAAVHDAYQLYFNSR
ncbi:MAG: TerB family tellurite resistance protein [Pseudomonadota bacterium]